MTMVQGSYFYAISKIQVAAAILLEYLAPILVAIFSICFWKERLTLSKIAALFLAFGGCYLVVGGYSLHLFLLNRLGIRPSQLPLEFFAACALSPSHRAASAQGAVGEVIEEPAVLAGGEM